MGVLRDRMAQSMVIRGLAADTQYAYLYWMRRFVVFSKRQPDKVDSVVRTPLRGRACEAPRAESPDAVLARGGRMVAGATPVGRAID